MGPDLAGDQAQTVARDPRLLGGYTVNIVGQQPTSLGGAGGGDVRGE